MYYYYEGSPADPKTTASTVYFSNVRQNDDWYVGDTYRFVPYDPTVVIPFTYDYRNAGYAKVIGDPVILPLDSSGLFEDCVYMRLYESDISKFDSHNVKDLNHAFSKTSFELRTSEITFGKPLDLSTGDLSNVKDASYMFGQMASYDLVNLESYNMRSLENASYMSINSWNHKDDTLDLTSGNCEHLANVSEMFPFFEYKALDISTGDFSNVPAEGVYSMIYGQPLQNYLEHIYGNETFDYRGYDGMALGTLFDCFDKLPNYAPGNPGSMACTTEYGGVIECPTLPIWQLTEQNLRVDPRKVK